MKTKLIALCVVLFAGVGCFSPQKPSCSYVCGDTMPNCPDDYECRSDGYCHLVGSTDSCLFSDAAVPMDMSMPVDMAGGDLASTD